MKKIALFAVCSIALLSSCGGKETIIKEVLVTTPPTQATDAPSQPAVNKYDEYLSDLRGYSGQANSWNDSDLIELGHLVCEALDTGNTLDDIVGIFSSNSSGSYDDELFAGTIMSAVVNICPEHQSYVESQL